VSFEVIEIV